jgi:hypothetical protein
MGLLGNDFWDDIVDINDKHKKRKDWTPPPKKTEKPPSNDLDKKGISGLTIFYRSLGSVILVATMIKAWFWAASLFDWTLLIVSLILIGVHRRLGAESAIDRFKPAFLDLHNRLKAVEAKLGAEENLQNEKLNK